MKLRYFVGLSVEEAAGILGVSAPTAKRDWAYARGWLGREIQRMRKCGAGGTRPEYFTRA